MQLHLIVDCLAETRKKWCMRDMISKNNLKNQLNELLN